MQNFTNIGAFGYEVLADGSLAKKEIDDIAKKAEGTGEKFELLSMKTKKVLLGVAGAMGAVFAGFVAFIKGAIPKASDFTEANSKMLTVFKDMKTEVSSNARSLTQYGYSLTEATKALGDTGDILTGIGYGQKDALKMSDTLARLSQDLVSFTNYSGGVSGANEVLTKAILGERDALIGLGIKLTETDLKRKGYNDNLSLQEKAEITLQAIMEQSKNALGDYARTQDQYANQQRKLAANVNDFSQKLAQRFLPAVGNMLKWANKQFERSQDLEQTTARLTELLRQRKEITDRLAGSVGNLTEQEKRNLEVQELQIQKELNETIDRLVKTYNKYYKVRKSAESIDGGTIVGKGNSKLEAMGNLIENIKKQIDETNTKIKSGFYDPEYVQHLTDVQVGLNQKLLQLNTEYLDIKNQQVFAVEELAKALRENLITEKELAYLPQVLRDQILAMSQNPQFIKSLESAGSEAGKKSGTKAGTAWSISFLEKVNLKEAVGQNESALIKELQEYIDVNQVYFDKYKKELLETGKISQKRKEFMDEYTQVQEKLNDLIAQEKKIYQDNFNAWAKGEQQKFSAQKKSIDEYKDMLSDVITDIGSISDIWSDGVNDKTKAAVALVKSWAGKLESVLGLIEKISLAQKAAEAAGTAAEIASGDIVAIITAVATTVISIVGAILDANKGEAEMLTTFKDINREVDRYLNQIEAINKILDYISNTYQAEDNPLGVQLDKDALEADEQLLKDQLDRYQQIIDAANSKFNLSLDFKDMTAEQIAAQADDISNKVADYQALLDAIEAADLQFRGTGRTRNASRDDLDALQAQARALIGDAAFNQFLAQEQALNISDQEMVADFQALLEDQMELLNNALTANSEYQDTLEQLQSVQDQLEILGNLETIGATPEGLQQLKDYLELLKQENQLLTQAGEDTKKNLNEQIDAIEQQKEIYESLNESGEYQSEINDLLIEQSQLRNKLEEGTAAAMKEQLDIANKLKGVGLFDEQNLFQVGLLGDYLDSQGASITQKMDVFQNLDVDGMAGTRIINIGTMNTEVNEAQGDTLESAVDQRMISILGGY